MGREDGATSSGGGEEKTVSGWDRFGDPSFLRMIMRMRGEGGFLTVVKWFEVLVAMVVGGFS